MYSSKILMMSTEDARNM